jgi:RNA polymerase sigma factor (sigma-70 family)
MNRYPPLPASVPVGSSVPGQASSVRASPPVSGQPAAPGHVSPARVGPDATGPGGTGQAGAIDTDAPLLAAYAAGDGQAAAALVGRHLPWLVALGARMLGGDRAEAEDVAQEALLRLWRIAPQWQPGQAKVRTWLYRVALNLLTDRLRRRARNRPLADAAEPADPGRGALAGLIAADRLAALTAAIATLPERQRQAVVLRHLQGLGNAEIAEILQTGIEAVESLLARGRRALALELAGHREALGYEETDD